MSPALGTDLLWGLLLQTLHDLSQPEAGADTGSGSVFAMGMIIRYASGPEPRWRRALEQCWILECNIDPLILRARLLHSQGDQRDARAVEEELQPVF